MYRCVCVCVYVFVYVCVHACVCMCVGVCVCVRERETCVNSEMTEIAVEYEMWVASKHCIHCANQSIVTN